MIFKKLLNNKVKEIAEQRKVLTETFPYTDWEKVPYTQYNKFLSLKDLIGECGVVWTNAFHRSNIEVETTRKYLKDYSGNERDIELFNFNFADNSGYGRFVNNPILGLYDYINNYVNYTYNNNVIHITEIKQSENIKYLFIRRLDSLNTGDTFKVKIKITGLDTLRNSISDAYIGSSEDDSPLISDIVTDGIYEIPCTKIEDAQYFSIYLVTPNQNYSNIDLKIEQIPDVDGCIVGDGVDDYGQCVKDFALPDDYTVVAMRELLKTYSGVLIAKATTTGNNAFLFEVESASNFSYGANTVISGSRPAIFSYQTKSQYNNVALTPGTSGDTESNKLSIFHTDANRGYKQAALYSFGIFNRTLTAEELALVEDCMYLELEYNTNILDNIEYYDILDARYRSNEEAEDKRNKWNGRLGKLHLTLSNYDYADLSGWNCYSLPAFNNYNKASLTNTTESKCKLTKIDGNGWLIYMGAPSNLKKYGLKIKIHKSTTKRVGLLFLSNENTTVANITLEEGLNTILSTSIPEEFANVCFDLNSFSVGEYIEIEQLPLYPGALVSDGMNDYAVSDEVIDEPIGGIVVHAEKISDPSGAYGNIFSSSVGLGGSSGKEIAGLVSKGSDSIIMGDPWTTLKKDAENIYGLSRVPISPGNKLMIGNNKSNEWGNAALYQLRLIKNQPTDIQLEVIKQQILREHNDYIKEMGWE